MTVADAPSIHDSAFRPVPVAITEGEVDAAFIELTIVSLLQNCLAVVEESPAG